MTDWFVNILLIAGTAQFRLERRFPILVSALLAGSLLRPVSATNFNQCMADITSGKWGAIGGTDNNGNPVADIANATAITYELCNRACGTSSEPFSWSIFSQQFSAWLLPWLALVSQLPFGAKLRSENLMSMLLAVGSPALAAYSLALTVLNGQWVAERFRSYSYPNTRFAVRILSSLQQAPLKITSDDGLLASLVVLPENDEWWAELTEWLDYTHTWSISAATSIAWVVIAYLFTVVDSFASITNSINANGQAVGSVWLWLLPIVIGWLQISPKCDSDRLNLAMNRANAIAYVGSEDDTIRADAVSTQRAFSLQRYRRGPLYRDEECSAPIFNYARFLPWVQAVEEVCSAFHYASENAGANRPVNWKNGWVRGDRYMRLHPDNRTGSLAQIEAYCQAPSYVRRSLWGPDVLSRFVVASLVALSLQWGTTGAAIIAVWFTPTKGLGCRSGAYLLYGALSTVVWMMLVISSDLAHYSTFPSKHPDSYIYRHFDAASASSAALLSIWLRRLGKAVATCNAIWIVLTCLLQFSSFYDRCYCNSSVLGLGSARAYDVIIFLSEDLADMKGPWIGGVVLAAGCAFFYVGFVNLFLDPPLPE